LRNASGKIESGIVVSTAIEVSISPEALLSDDSLVPNGTGTAVVQREPIIYRGATEMR